MTRLDTDEQIAAVMRQHGDGAFPFLVHGPTEQHWGLGLSKREWFAGMALQGLLASAGDGIDVKNSAKAAAWVADNLIAALAKKPAD